MTACPVCDAAFEPRKGKFYCSHACARKAADRKAKERKAFANLGRVRECAWCKGRFTGRRADALYCSDACCEAANGPASAKRRVSPEQGSGEGLPPGPPAFLIGERMRCARRGWVIVTGRSATGWPLCDPQKFGSRPAYVWCPALAGVLRELSNAEAAAVLGLDVTTVSRWRKTLGVPRMTPGTRELWKRAVGKLHRKQPGA